MKKLKTRLWDRDHSNPINDSFDNFNKLDEPYRLRENERTTSQPDCYNKIKDAEFALTNTPTAWGKGVIIRFSAIYNAIKYPNQKIIIAVPTLQIGNGLLRTIECENKDFGTKWFRPCHETISTAIDRSVQELKNFLEREASNKKECYNDRIIITTHSSLVRSYSEDPNLFKNVLVIVDEAHHCCWSNYDNDEQEDCILEQNKLGKLIEHAFTKKKDNLKIHFYTATYIRGDRYEIIPSKYRNEFVEFKIPMSEFLDNETKYLESLSYNYMLYDKHPSECLMEEFKVFKKFIGYISYGNPSEKKNKVNDYYKAISQCKNPLVIENDDGTVTVMRKGEALIGCVLVSEDDRHKMYDYIEKAHNDEVPLDFVISLNCFVEGASWKHAEKMFVIGNIRSVTKILQKIGRLLRDCEGKENVEIIHILQKPFREEKKNVSDKTKNKFGDHFKTILLVMEQMDVIFNSPLPSRKSDKVKTPNLLLDEIKDVDTYIDITTELKQELIRLSSNGLKDDDLIKEFKPIAEDILKSYDVDNNLDNIVNNFIDRLEDNRHKIRNANIPSKTNLLSQLNLGIDVKELRDLEILDIKYVGQILYFITDRVDKNLLSRLKGYYGYRFLWDDCYKILEKYKLEFGNVDVPALYVVPKKNMRLGMWVQVQRQNYRINKLSNYRLKKLKDIGIKWTVVPNFLSFDKAREFSINLNLKSGKEWTDYCHLNELPIGVPTSPRFVYKNKGWISWPHWLGHNNYNGYKGDFLHFDVARNFVRNLKLKNYKEWNDYCKSGKCPTNIPHSPLAFYKDWISLPDWLGTFRNGNNKEYLSYNEARNIIHKLKLKNRKEWNTYSKSKNRPRNIPLNPQYVYKNKGWISYHDWLGPQSIIATRNIEYLSFVDAKLIIHKLKLKNGNEYKKWWNKNKPKNIPKCACRTYSDEWMSEGDWLGTRIGHKRGNYWDFEKSRDFVRRLNIKNINEWNEYKHNGNLNSHVPINPQYVYKNSGWNGIPDWLGNGNSKNGKKIIK